MKLNQYLITVARILAWGFTVYGYFSEVQSQNNVFVKNEVILPEIHRNVGRLDSRCITTHLFLQHVFVNQSFSTYSDKNNHLNY